MKELTSAEIEAVLAEETVGRLGMYDAAEQRTYVVPISYVYHDRTLYFHSAPGLKLDLLRAHPRGICFQVDQIAGEGDWKSVVCWGTFEAIEPEDERQQVLRSFGDRLLRGPLRDRQSVGRGGQLGAGETVYRLNLTEMTGKSDSSGWVAALSN